MTTHTNKSFRLLLWIAGAIVILFSVTGIAAVVGWIPTSMGRSSDNPEIFKSDKPSANTYKSAVSRMID